MAQAPMIVSPAARQKEILVRADNRLCRFRGVANSVVVCQELSGVDASEIAAQDGEIDPGEVHEHQGVERFAERWVDVEADQSRVQSQILTEQYGYPFAI